MSLSLSKKAQSVKPSSTLSITAKVKELKAGGVDVVGFGAGEPDFNTPDNICNAAIEAIKSGFTKYTPASGTNELKEAVCRKFQEFNGLHYEPNQIVISNGGKHSLTNIFDAILNPGDEVIIPAPIKPLTISNIISPPPPQHTHLGLKYKQHNRLDLCLFQQPNCKDNLFR